MHIKSDLILVYILMIVLVLTVYYVGTASLLLTGAKVGQQLGYFLTGRDSAGRPVGGVTPQPNPVNPNNNLSFPFINYWQNPHP